jgi:ABC-type Na+ efflux pump permease subunit
MAENISMVKWLARIGVGLAGGGLILLFLPWICWIAPVLSQVGVAFGLIGYVRSSNMDDPQTRLLSIAAMVIGLISMVVAAMMYINDWMIW